MHHNISLIKLETKSELNSLSREFRGEKKTLLLHVRGFVVEQAELSSEHGHENARCQQQGPNFDSKLQDVPADLFHMEIITHQQLCVMPVMQGKGHAIQVQFTTRISALSSTCKPLDHLPCAIRPRFHHDCTTDLALGLRTRRQILAQNHKGDISI